MYTTYENVRELAGWLDLSHWGLARVIGADRLRFLQGQTTNDLNPLQPGQGAYTAFCTPTGHLLSDAYILNTGDDLLILLPELTFGDILTRLHSLIIMDEVEIIPLQEALGVLSVQGARAEGALEEVGIELAPERELAHGIAFWEGVEMRVVRCDRTGLGGYDLHVPYEKMESLKISLVGSGVLEINSPLWDVFRYEAGIPLYGVDMDEKVLAPEMGKAFERKYVSYSKGCYTGQEIIMRIHSRGHTNRTWLPLILEGEDLPQRGDALEAPGRPDAGWITGAVRSPAFGAVLAWGFVRNAYTEPGTHLHVLSGNARLPARVHRLGGQD
jgi:folate-binding protein YgfZ